jgi:hypothetical protein
MEDKRKQASLDDLWGKYYLAFTQAKEIIEKMKTEPDHTQRAKLRKSLRRFGLQRVHLLDQMDEVSRSNHT